MKKHIFIEPINIKWQPGLNIFFNNTKEELINSVDIYNEFFLEFMAEEYISYLRYTIERQKFRSFRVYPLSKEYAERKEREGLDPRVLISTGRYLDSIRVYLDKNELKVSVEDEELDGGLSMLGLAKMLEFGTSRMPRRVHWHPAYRSLSNNIRSFYKKFSEIV